MKEQPKKPRRKRASAEDRAASSGGPTLRDVAERVGVSLATVSVILNNAPTADNFSEQTRNLVRQAAAELGYTVNPLARALRRKRSGVLGCILFNRQDIYYTRFVAVAEAYAREQGYDFVVNSMGYDLDRFESCLAQMLAWRVEGLMLMLGGHVLPPNLKARLLACNMPYILGDSVEPGQPNSAALFSYRSAPLLAEHLYLLGHRRFAVAGVKPANVHSSERLRGLEDWLATVGIGIHPRLKAEIQDGHFGAHAGHACALALLEAGEPFTALVCLNDLVALGALTALAEQGVSVPAACSVVGFGDIPLDYAGAEENRLGRYMSPPLTTVRLPMREFAREAMRRLVSRVARKEDEARYSVELQPVLIARASTAQAPEA